MVESAYKGELALLMNDPSEDQIIVWARQIYDKVQNCLQQEKLQSFFISSVNLLDKFYDSYQHEMVFKTGIEVRPAHADESSDDLSEMEEESDSEEEDIALLRKLFLRMLKGILMSCC